MRRETVGEAAALLATSYRYRDAVDKLERDLSRRVTGVPEPLRHYVAVSALAAVAAHIAGEPAAGCPWDCGDPLPLRADLAELWWACHDQYLTDYRENRPLAGPATP